MFIIPLPNLFKTYILPEEEHYEDSGTHSLTEVIADKSLEEQGISEELINKILAGLGRMSIGIHLYYFYSMIKDVTPMYFSLPYYLNISKVPVCILYESEQNKNIKYLVLPDSFKTLENIVEIQDNVPILSFYSSVDVDSLSTYINMVIIKSLGGTEADDFVIKSYSMDYLFSSVHGDTPFIVISKRVFDLIYKIGNAYYKPLYEAFLKEDLNKYKIIIRNIYQKMVETIKSESDFRYPVESLFSFISSVYKDEVHSLIPSKEEEYEEYDDLNRDVLLKTEEDESEMIDEEGIHKSSKVSEIQKYYLSLLVFQKYDTYFNDITDLDYELESDIFYLSLIKLIRKSTSEEDFKVNLIHYLCIYAAILNPITKYNIDTFEIDSDCKLEIENKSNILFGYDSNFVEGSFRYIEKDLDEKIKVYKKYVGILKDSECYEEMSRLKEDKNIIKSYANDKELDKAISSLLSPNLFALYRANNDIGVSRYLSISVKLFENLINRVAQTDHQMAKILESIFKSHPIFYKMVENSSSISDCEKNYYRALLYYTYFICKNSDIKQKNI
ncbi:MAG: hypothetical protein QXS19_09480 [Candidatus Methanomethylicia archaeon]